MLGWLWVKQEHSHHAGQEPSVSAGSRRERLGQLWQFLAAFILIHLC